MEILSQEELDAMKLPELAKLLKEVKEEYARVNKLKASTYKYLQHISIGIIPDKMAEIGVKNITFDEGFRMQLRTDAYCTVNEEQRPRLYAWLEEHGVLEDLKSETINASTLKAYVKELDENCEDLPPEDSITYTPYTQASVVKA